MDIAPILSSGLMTREKFTTSNIISRQIKASKISLLKSKIRWCWKTKISLLVIFMKTSKRETIHHGLGTHRSCQRRMLRPTDLTYLILPRFGHTVTTLSKELVKWPWIETQRTITLRLNKLLSHQATWFQVLSHPTIRCSKEDFSHTQTLTGIDLVRTTSKFQLIAHTEPELPHISEMVQPLLMEITEELSTTSQTPREDQRKISNTHGHRCH